MENIKNTLSKELDELLNKHNLSIYDRIMFIDNYSRQLSDYIIEEHIQELSDINENR